MLEFIVGLYCPFPENGLTEGLMAKEGKGSVAKERQRNCG